MKPAVMWWSCGGVGMGGAGLQGCLMHGSPHAYCLIRIRKFHPGESNCSSDASLLLLSSVSLRCWFSIHHALKTLPNQNSLHMVSKNKNSSGYTTWAALLRLRFTNHPAQSCHMSRAAGTLLHHGTWLKDGQEVRYLNKHNDQSTEESERTMNWRKWIQKKKKGMKQNERKKHVRKGL